MKVTIVSGIWPPDVGGPAIHAPALARFLASRGHGVEVVTTASSEPGDEPFPVGWVSRRLPPGARHAAVIAAVARAGRRADVVYATSMIRRAAAGARLARRPYVVKLVADEAYERARRHGLFAGSLEEFQRLEGDARIRALRASRTVALRGARHIFVPSGYLRAVALAWGLDPARVSVLHNPAPVVPPLPPRTELRHGLARDGEILLAFAGRLTEQKDIDVLLRAVAEVPGVHLALLGDGPERARVEDERARLGLSDRVRLLGSGDRNAVLRLFAAADVAVLSSRWENFPHTVVEALAVGTPVVATAVGGVPEIVVDGENGLLVPPGDVDAFAAALRRVCADDELRERLAAAATPSVAPLAEDALLAVVEDRLSTVVGG
ncbi:MAG: glycosyltransferase family 4 protein [Gaiellales bacterium]